MSLTDSSQLVEIVQDGQIRGVTLPESVTHIEWQTARAMLDTYVSMEESLPFLVGDFYNEVRDFYRRQGHKLAEIDAMVAQILPDAFGTAGTRQVKTIKNWSWICDKVPAKARHGDLTISYHDAVAGINNNPELQRELLEWAVETNATVMELREEVRVRTGENLLEYYRQSIEDIFRCLNQTTPDLETALTIARKARSAKQA